MTGHELFEQRAPNNKLSRQPVPASVVDKYRPRCDHHLGTRLCNGETLQYPKKGKARYKTSWFDPTSTADQLSHIADLDTHHQYIQDLHGYYTLTGRVLCPSHLAAAMGSYSFRDALNSTFPVEPCCPEAERRPNQLETCSNHVRTDLDGVYTSKDGKRHSSATCAMRSDYSSYRDGMYDSRLEKKGKARVQKAHKVKVRQGERSRAVVPIMWKSIATGISAHDAVLDENFDFRTTEASLVSQPHGPAEVFGTVFAICDVDGERLVQYKTSSAESATFALQQLSGLVMTLAAMEPSLLQRLSSTLARCMENGTVSAEGLDGIELDTTLFPDEEDEDTGDDETSEEE